MKLTWVVVQSLWLLCCVAAVWLQYDRVLMLLLHGRFYGLYRNKFFIYVDETP